jgi:hypothetical protein
MDLLACDPVHACGAPGAERRPPRVKRIERVALGNERDKAALQRDIHRRSRPAILFPVNVRHDEKSRNAF